MKYKIIITSDNNNGHEYETNSKSAMKAAIEYGRCEGGEIVTVTYKNGTKISQVRWTPENGGKYYRTEVHK